MTSFHLVILFALSFALFCCEGKITSPPDGTNLTIVPGGSDRIIWNFDDDVNTVTSRSWTFTSSDGLRSDSLGAIVGNTDPVMLPDILPGITITKPATLVLNNVNQSYDGTYRLSLVSTAGTFISDVRVFIAKKPTVTLSCPHMMTLNEGDSFMCECKGENGNPPAKVTWYKDGKEIQGKTGTLEQLLSLTNIDETDSGTYRCVAESYPDPKYRDENSTRLNVTFGPKDTSIKFNSNPAILGKSVTITCSSRGFPEPNYKIFFNGNHLGDGKTHVIKNVETSNAGVYECRAENGVGPTDNASETLKVTEPTTTTAPTPTRPSNKQIDSGPDDDGDSGLGVGAIIGIVIGGLVVLIIIIVVVWRCKMKEKDGYRGKRDVGAIEMHDQNEYDSVRNELSGSGSKPQASKPPPVYAQVDKNNREGKPLYATLDTAAMNTKGSNKRSEENHPEPTQYASIDFEKSGEVPKADLV